MPLTIVVRVGSDKAPEVGFVPTLQLEEHNLPRTTVTPFHFDRSSACSTHEDAVALAEAEAIRILSRRYPKGTEYRIEKE